MSRRSLPRRLLNRLEIDRATFDAMASRYWTFISGPVTYALIVATLTPAQQGYYYTFWSLIALQSFFEAAMPVAILTTAGRLSAGGDSTDIITDDPKAGTVDATSAKLRDLWLRSNVWFVGLNAGFLLLVGVAGYLFFEINETASEVAWRRPWLATVALTALSFQTLPTAALLEGVGRVRQIYRMQLIRAVAGSAAVWATLACGGGLWTPAAAVASKAACEVALLTYPHRDWLRRLYRSSGEGSIDWRRDIWPFQSGMMFKGYFTYLNADVMVPVVFAFGGAAAAGRFGMTYNLLMAVRGGWASLLRTRMARLAALVGGGDFAESDRIHRRLQSVATAGLVVTYLLFVVGLLAAGGLEPRLYRRLLTAGTTVLLCVGTVASFRVDCQWIYIHAFGRSPYVLPAIACCLTSGIAIYLGGQIGGADGVASAYAVVQVGLFWPLSSAAFSRTVGRWRSVDRTAS